MSDQEPTSADKRARLLETIYRPGFSTLGHGTNKDIEKKTFENGFQ
jgi:hypothetical protein